MAAVPRVAIFLDLDGVLRIHPNDLSLQEKASLEAKRLELFAELKIKIRSQNVNDAIELSNLSSVLAAVHFLDSDALENLRSVVDRISSAARPIIVIISSYRECCSLTDLQERVFARYGWLAERIVDKTADNEGLYKLRQATGRLPPGKTPHEIYRESHQGKSMDFSRGREIQGWLEQNGRDIQSYVILDDCWGVGTEISTLHPDSFVPIDAKKLLTKEDANLAVAIALTPFFHLSDLE